MDDLLVEQSGSILTCTLNRPHANNSLNGSMLAKWLHACQQADLDDSVRVIVTRANGPHFCVGADAGGLGSYKGMTIEQVYFDAWSELGPKSGVGHQARTMETLGVNRVALAVSEIRTPMIAAVRGAAAGGGFALALMHHFRIGDTSAKFVTAFGPLGLALELGISVYLPAIIGAQQALNMYVSNRSVLADEALALGILDRRADPASFEQVVDEFAKQLATQAPLAMRATIQELRYPIHASLRERLELEWRNQAVLFRSKDREEGASALVQRRRPNFTGE